MFSFYIAKRYLLTKKSHHAINIISGISVCGVAFATAALVCILSVFNGFQDMVANLFTAFDPELKIVAAEGKFMQADSKALENVKNHDEIAVFSEVLEDQAMLMTQNRQVMATVKGVDDNFEQLIDFKRIKFGDGVYELHADVIEYGILGVNLLSNLGVDVGFQSPIQVYAPVGDEHIDMNDPSESFNQDELYSPGVAFNVSQQKYDSHYVLTSLRFARNLFDRSGMISSLELKLKKGADIDKVKSQLKKELGSKYVVMDRYEQQEDTFKIMKIEKLISYIFLTFILMIACFNIIGSISMLIIDKKNDAMTLRNLGATEHQIANIFMIEGRLISLVGAIIGIVLGLSLCLIQQHFGIIKFGQSAGSYIIDSYPVSVHVTDIIIVFVTVLVVGLVSVWYPVRQLSKKYTSVMAMLIVAGMMTSCSTNDRQFKIEGQFKDMLAGELYIYNQDNSDAKFDTIYINNGEFVYAGNAEELTPYTLVFPNALEQVIFVQNGSVIHYNASANDLKNYTVDGNEENELMNEFRKQTNGMNPTQQREVAETFINDHPESAVAIYLFDRYLVQEQSTSLETLKKTIKTLKKAQPQNRLVLKVENTMKLIENGQVGKTIPSIELKTKSKRTINIGKTNVDYTVLVYWSTWMPDRYDFVDDFAVLTEDYADYTNVKIIAISLDSEIFKWENTTREDTTYCEHVCDGKVWDSEPVKKLGITSIPTFIIADKNHKIVARGSSVDELDRELQKLVD